MKLTNSTDLHCSQSQTWQHT